MKKYLIIAIAVLALALPGVASATVSPSKAEHTVRTYLQQNERRVGIPNPIIKCWVLSTHRTRCNVHTRTEGTWIVENIKVDVYQGGGINWDRQFGH